jgi:hypothetical protein
MRLLEIIKTDRPLEREYQVYLDFYPNFHKGPPSQPGNKYAVGSYGVTWDNWNGNSTLAIWQLVSRIIPQARSQGLDFESPYTAFRKWLNDGPCWRVATTLPALLSPLTPPAELCAMVDCANPTHNGSKRKFTHAIGNRHGGWEWATVPYPCQICHTQPLGIFFGYAEFHTFDIGQSPHMICWGCKLTHVLNTERDHYKADKRAVLRQLLSVLAEDYDELNTTDLNAFIENLSLRLSTGERMSENLARAIQIKRERVMEKYGNDREIEERQMKLKKSELNMYGSVNRTGKVDDKFLDPWNYDMEWNLGTVDRPHQVPVHR